MKTFRHFSILLGLIMAFLFTNVSYAQDQPKVKGYEKTIELNGGIGMDKFSKYSLGITMLNGYRFNHYFFVGAGVGYEYFYAKYYTTNIGHHYESFDGKHLLKLSARVKANLTKGKVSPFFAFDIGGAIDVGKNPYRTAKGLFIEPAFGIDFKLNDQKTAIFLMVGYHGQNSQYTRFSSNGNESLEKAMAGLIDIRLGIKF